MSLLDINLVDEPLNIDSFSYLNDEDYPVCLVGFQLKNLYDQKRLIFNKKFNSIDIIHLIPEESILPTFFRGVKFDINPKYNYFIKKLEALGTLRSLKIELNYYKELLKEYNLTCDNCYAYLRKGIYPIDSEHLSDFVLSNASIKTFYEFALDKSDKFNFQSIGYFVIYILSNKNIYSNTTNNFLHTVVKKYSES
jgi:hypothetical protein